MDVPGLARVTIPGTPLEPNASPQWRFLNANVEEFENLDLRTDLEYDPAPDGEQWRTVSPSADCRSAEEIAGSITGQPRIRFHAVAAGEIVQNCLRTVRRQFVQHTVAEASPD